MPVHVSDEVDPAALPGAAEDPGDRRLQALVLVADREPHAIEPATDERSQELDPEGLGLRLADVDLDHLASSRVVDRVGDDQRL